MPRQRQRQLGFGNPAAIVAHARQPHAAGFDFHLDALRAGVEAVFHQLLDDGRRPLDDLAGRDLVDEMAVEDADGHGARSLPPTMPRRAATAQGCYRSSTCAPAPALRRDAARRVPSGALP